MIPQLNIFMNSGVLQKGKKNEKLITTYILVYWQMKIK